MATNKMIDIAGKLNAATTEGILADSKQINYGEDNTVEKALDDFDKRIKNVEPGGGGEKIQAITNSEIDDLFAEESNK